MLVLPNPTFSAHENRIALVIGNGAYKAAPLRNPVNDASDIAGALESLGFSVSLKTDTDQRSMERAIRDFGKQLRTGGVGLFYYAGHGIQVKGRNYLIPIGAAIESESDVKYESVDAGRVLGKMEDAGNNLNIIILDACRDNPFARSFRSSERGLAKMDAPTGSILAYATAPGSVASDGPGRNGLYTSALLKHMMTSGVKIEDVFKKVRIEVVNDSGKKQVPWESSSLIGDFYFNSPRGISIETRPPADTLQSKTETARPAGISPHKTRLSITERDGRFIKLANGIVKDTRTQLVWAPADSGMALTWDAAKTYCMEYSGGGYTDWRLPTLAELASLYDQNYKNKHGYPITRLIDLGECCP